MRILILGDLHGSSSVLKDATKSAIKYNVDRVMQVGDFGWFPKLYPNYPNSSILSDTNFHWIDGNHEDFNSINKGILPRECTYHSRGTVENIGGVGILYLGGAHSIDWKRRQKGISWFPEENISKSDLRKALSYGSDDIDIVFTHDCPDFVKIENPTQGAWLRANGFGLRPRRNRAKLTEVWKKYKPKKWFFGHWHRTFKYTHKNITDFRCLGGESERPTIGCILDTTTLQETYVTL